ncbi:MAG: transposase [Chloroflexota bacterium]|nr:MAG: transposase [Chloroflexota bacterium]
MKRDDIVPGLCDRFGMDVRFARDAILEAAANQAALRELIPEYLANTKAKITKVETRLKDYWCGKRKPKRATLEETLTGLEHRLTKLQAKRDKWQTHLDEGTLPSVIFGSAAAFHTRRKGQMSHPQWQRRRRKQFWSRGENSRNRGNQHVRIAPKDDGFTISIATLPAVKGRLTYYTVDLWIPEGKRELLRAGLKHSYAVRIIYAGGAWRAHITIREKVSGEMLPDKPRKNEPWPRRMVMAGLDCNTDRLTVAISSPRGNLLARRTFWLPNLGDMRTAQAEPLIGKTLTDILDWLGKKKVTGLTVESLKFAQDHDTHHRSNRATTKFRTRIVKLAIRLALRRGLQVVQVNPAHTSVIGKYKYALAYGMSGHEAAAFVIARRGQGWKERLPKEIVAKLPQLRERLVAEAQTKPRQDKLRATYLRWAEKLADWKNQHYWSLWSMWDKASGLIVN